MGRILSSLSSVGSEAFNKKGRAFNINNAEHMKPDPLPIEESAIGSSEDEEIGKKNSPRSQMNLKNLISFLYIYFVLEYDFFHSIVAICNLGGASFLPYSWPKTLGTAAVRGLKGSKYGTSMGAITLREMFGIKSKIPGPFSEWLISKIFGKQAPGVFGDWVLRKFKTRALGAVLGRCIPFVGGALLALDLSILTYKASKYVINYYIDNPDIFWNKTWEWGSNRYKLIHGWD